MNRLSLLTDQTVNTYEWTNRILRSIPVELWDTIPSGIETTVSWQAGHLMMSYLYHTILCIQGPPMTLFTKIPAREYSVWYVKASQKLSVGKTSPLVLREHLSMVEEYSLATLRSLNDADLDLPLESTQMKHPIATTKFGAIDWNIKHTMYHCGQLGLLKRAIHERFNFGI